MQGGSSAEGTSERAKPCVMVLQDALVFPMRLPDVLSRADCEIVELYPSVNVVEALASVQRRPDLLILPVRSGQSATVQRIRDVRSSPTGRELPILGVVAAADRVSLDLGELRELGVSGLVDRDAVPEHVVFRVNQIVRAYPERRRCERAPAFFEVELEAQGVVSVEYAVSLSVGGLGLTCSRTLEPNTDVLLRFLSGERDLGELKGRVLHCTSDPNAVPSNRVGVVFYPLGAEQHALLEQQVERLLEERKVSSPASSEEEA